MSVKISRIFVYPLFQALFEILSTYSIFKLLPQEKFTSVVKKKRVKPDAVLLMTVGKLGECGELQAYFDKMGVPFTFSGVEETRTAFNKHETVDMLREEGLPVVKSVLVR